MAGGENGWKHLVRLWWQWTIHGSVWLWCPCPSLASTKTPRNANLCHVQVVSRTSSYSHLITYLTLILLTAATPSPSPSSSHHFTSHPIPSKRPSQLGSPPGIYSVQTARRTSPRIVPLGRQSTLFRRPSYTTGRVPNGPIVW